MTHFLTLVLVDGEVERKDAEQAVEPLLAPYDEGGEWFRDDSRWDWWVVGGRWTGWASGYKPWEDEINQERCYICAGTGTRPRTKEEAEALLATHGAQDSIIGPQVPLAWDENTKDEWIEKCNGCNSCHGTGKTVKFEYAPHDGDVIPTRNLLKAGLPTRTDEVGVVSSEWAPRAMVTPDGKWHESARIGWWGATIPDEKGQGEKPEDLWIATVKALLAQWPDTTAVVCDLHV